MRLKICKHGDGCGYCLLHDEYCPDEPCPNEELIDYEPVKHGRWEERFFTTARQRVCSCCFSTVRQPSYDKGETALFHYCPNCGAKMDLEVADEQS